MNQPGDGKSFMDRGTIIAFLVVIVFWFGWSRYMDTKYPQPATPAPSTQTSAPDASSVNSSAPPTATLAGAETGAKPEAMTGFSDNKWNFQISSHGMGLKNIVLLGYLTRENGPVILAEVGSRLPFSTYLVGNDEPVDFAITQKGSNVFVGTSTVGSTEIEKTLTVDSSTYTISTDVTVRPKGGGFRGVGTYLTDKILPPVSSGIFGGSRDHQDFYVYHDDKRTRHLIHTEKGVQAADTNVSVLGLTGHYFATAILDSSAVAPRFETNVAPGAQIAQGRLIYEPISNADSFSIKYKAFAGPKSFPLLHGIDERLAGLIDFGTFAIIGHPLLWLLKFFYSLFGNYGWAIVALTIVVRALVLPFNVYSYRSMKVMQVIQPEMKSLREKHKDDPVKMNAETMALMKKHKANPLGGCLPMLLQLPIFIALYQVLGQSIELYREPFIFWIHDLSAKDPLYVLPVLMGISMFVQQKITPTAVDPQQAKIMMMMPVIFSFFMLSLPSGLTLYIFVSTLFGIIQQYLFLRDRRAQAVVAKAV